MASGGRQGAQNEPDDDTWGDVQPGDHRDAGKGSTRGGRGRAPERVPPEWVQCWSCKGFGHRSYSCPGPYGRGKGKKGEARWQPKRDWSQGGSTSYGRSTGRDSTTSSWGSRSSNWGGRSETGSEPASEAWAEAWSASASRSAAASTRGSQDAKRKAEEDESESEGPVRSRKAQRDQERLDRQIQKMREAYDHGEMTLSYRPTGNKDEALVRRALASFRGSDEDAELPECMEKLMQCTRTVRGQVLEKGVFSATLSLALSQTEYTGLDGVRMINLRAKLATELNLDLPASEMDRNPERVLEVFKEQLANSALLVANKSAPLMEKMFRGSKVSELQIEFEAAPDPRELKDLVVGLAEAATQKLADREAEERLRAAKADAGVDVAVAEEDRAQVGDAEPRAGDAEGTRVEETLPKEEEKEPPTYVVSLTPTPTATSEDGGRAAKGEVLDVHTPPEMEPADVRAPMTPRDNPVAVTAIKKEENEPSEGENAEMKEEDTDGPRTGQQAAAPCPFKDMRKPDTEGAGSGPKTRWVRDRAEQIDRAAQGQGTGSAGSGAGRGSSSRGRAGRGHPPRDAEQPASGDLGPTLAPRDPPKIHKKWEGMIQFEGEETGRPVSFLGTMEHLLAWNSPLVDWLHEPKLEGGMIMGFHGIAPVLYGFPTVESTDRNGDVCWKPLAMPTSKQYKSVEGHKNKDSQSPFAGAVWQPGCPLVRPNSEAKPGMRRVSCCARNALSGEVNLCMTAEGLEELGPLEFEALVGVPVQGKRAPSIKLDHLKVMVRETFMLECVWVQPDRSPEGQHTLVRYLRRTICGRGFTITTKTDPGLLEQHLRRADWRCVAERQFDAHCREVCHVVEFANYAERFIAVMGPCRPGVGARHCTRSVALNPWTYLYRGMVVDSMSTQGCPLPCRTCVNRDLGAVENMMPLVWRALKEKKVQCVLADNTYNIRVEDVDHLAAGVIYWGTDELKAQQGYTYAYDRVPNMYLDLSELPRDEETYFEKFLQVYPTADEPHPEIALLASALQKWSEEKVDKMTAKEKAVWQMPPATERQAWFGVVRIGVKPGTLTARACAGRVPLVCKVQAFESAGGARAMTAWGLKMAKQAVAQEVLEAMARLEQMDVELRSSVRMEPDGDDHFCKGFQNL